MVGDIELRYVFPAHTGNPPVTVKNSDGTIHAPVGTVVEVRARTLERYDSAALELDGQVLGPADLVAGRELLATLTVEHYPGMTEKSLQTICDQARERWRLESLLIVHRVGPLAPTDQIVLVAVTSAHRGEAFAACEFVMDYLKTRAPFWKKEATPQGERWVEARDSDELAARRWSAS